MSLDNALPSRYSGNIKLAILSLLNSLGAVNDKRTIGLEELAKYLAVPVNIVENTLNELLREKYIERKNNGYYISSKGIAVVVGFIS